MVKPEMNSLQDTSQILELRNSLVEQKVGDKRLALLSLLLTYQSESLASQKFLNTDLRQLKPSSSIFENGSGPYFRVSGRFNRGG